MSLYSMVNAISNSRSSSPARHLRPATSNGGTVEPHLTKFRERVVLELKQKLARGNYRLSHRVCPGCRGRFVHVDVDQVPLEYCRHCRSWWFDAAELMHFTESFEDFSDGDCVDRVSKLPCPVCASLMHKQPLRMNANFMVHVCPQRHGVFLDDDEFERALEVSDRVDGLAGHLNDEHLAVWRQLQASLSVGDFTPSELACVECGAHAVIITLNGIDIDYCTQCQSCWFDAKELQHFTGQRRDVPGDHLTSRETANMCPKCHCAMRLYQFHPKSNVMIEACPGGHGVYLQSNQFPRVLKASE